MSKPSLSASTAHISASTNRFNHAADASTSSLIACGSGKLIALWNIQVSDLAMTSMQRLTISSKDVDDRGIFQTLPGHEGVVTCVRFLAPDSFASADDKGVVRYWRLFETRVRQSTSRANDAHSVYSGGLPQSCKRTEKPSLYFAHLTNSCLPEVQILPSRSGRCNVVIKMVQLSLFSAMNPANHSR